MRKKNKKIQFSTTSAKIFPENYARIIKNHTSSKFELVPQTVYVRSHRILNFLRQAYEEPIFPFA